MTTGWLRIRAVGESILAGFAWITVPLLPRAGVVGLAHFLGNVGFCLARRDRKVALANLDVAYGDALSTEEKKRIARGAFRTFALVLLDLFWFGWRTHRRVGAHVSFDPSFDHYFKTAPLVAVTAHLGNWEVMGLATARHGEPPFSVAAPLDNRFVDRMLNRLRRGTGQEIAEQTGAVRTLLKALKRGARAALLLDQNTLPQDGGVFVTLFGRSVPMAKTAAGLASHSGAPIVFVYCVADETGHYRAYGRPPLQAGEKRGEEREVTQEIARLLEDAVKTHPDQWLWMYKRWKYIPEGESSEKYPFYARRLKTEQAGEPE